MLKLSAGTFCAWASRLILVALWQAAPWNAKEAVARRDRHAKDTIAMQTAIDTCAATGGGTVCVPAGDYGCGYLELHGNVVLYVESGAVLWVRAAKEDGEQSN
jgi:polygalacturonase